mmetsp:Transcript_36099/g.114771  ORF Transcript_36099/g.114771 Transcript_36099/m.114771 type:complete len:234 (+) Transcript_36099:814-1515(+)
MSLARSSTVALASSSFASVTLILSSLFSREELVFWISRSHQFLWSSSSRCSAMSRKTIFWIMLLTCSKGPVMLAATSSAKRAKDLECTSRASSRSRFTARARGSSTCSKATPPCSKAAPPSSSSRGEVGSEGFSGFSVRTPVTFARIFTPISRAFISPSRIFVRSSHSVFFIMQDFSVLPKASLSAFRSALTSLSVPSASSSSLLTSPRRFSFSFCASSAASMAASRAFFARS